MPPLQQSFLDVIERPHADQRLLWLLEVELDRGSEVLPPVLVRLCDGEAELAWPVGHPDAWVWSPFPFSFAPIEQTQEGDLYQIDITVDNTARLLMRWLHDGDGLEGNRATLFLVSEAGLAIAYPAHEFQRYDLEVATAAATEEAVTFRLAVPNFFTVSSPTDRYVPKRCRWAYGSEECGYPLNAFAAFPTCPHTQPACIDRGADLRVRGLPPVLPGNYGGHPGVSRARA